MTLAEYREREAHHEYKQAFELQKIRLLLLQNAKEGAKLQDIFEIPLFDNTQNGEIEEPFTGELPSLYDVAPDLREE